MVRIPRICDAARRKDLDILAGSSVAMTSSLQEEILVVVVVSDGSSTASKTTATFSSSSTSSGASYDRRHLVIYIRATVGDGMEQL